jgi:hypothetical protein
MGGISIISQAIDIVLVGVEVVVELNIMGEFWFGHKGVKSNLPNIVGMVGVTRIIPGVSQWWLVAHRGQGSQEGNGGLCEAHLPTLFLQWQ